MAIDMENFWPSVVQVVPTDNHEVYAYFNDGSIRLFDLKPLLKSGTVFEPLRDLATFKEKLTVINGTVAWDMGGNRDPKKCVDIDEFSLFSQDPVEEPKWILN